MRRPKTPPSFLPSFLPLGVTGALGLLPYFRVLSELFPQKTIATENSHIDKSRILTCLDSWGHNDKKFFERIFILRVRVIWKRRFSLWIINKLRLWKVSHTTLILHRRKRIPHDCIRFGLLSSFFSEWCDNAYTWRTKDNIWQQIHRKPMVFQNLLCTCRVSTLAQPVMLRKCKPVTWCLLRNHLTLKWLPKRWGPVKAQHVAMTLNMP